MTKPRIVIATFGSYGDIHPFIAVALRLKQLGFAPVIATMEFYRRKVESEGLAFRPVRPSLEQIYRDAGMTEKGEAARRIARRGVAHLVETMITPYLDQTYEDLCEVLSGAELVIASSLSFAARLAAEKLQLPTASVLLSPLLYFSAYDPPHVMGAPWLPRLNAVFGLPATKFVLDMARARMRRQLRAVTDFRARLGLPPSRRDELMDGPLRGELIASLYSPLLGDLPPDAPPQSFIAGFTFYDSEVGGPAILPRALSDFLDHGPAPIVFTLGSFLAHDPTRFYEASAMAARKIGRRAVLLAAPETEAAISCFASDDVFTAGYVPHSLIFPRAAAIVHHGGIGTLAQAMRSGRPQLICPALGDQADNAERLVRLGVAKRLDLKRYTAERAAKALGGLAADDGEAAARARQAADQVGREDGAGALASRITAVLGAGLR